MKITPQDLNAMRKAIAPLDTKDRRARYQARAFPRAELVKDIDKRYRWDLLHESGYRAVELYDYADDTHIDTALRNIVPVLGDPSFAGIGVV